MKKKDNIKTSFTTASANSTENQQWTKYKTNSGHGFSAEDANALTDILKGKDVDVRLFSYTAKKEYFKYITIDKQYGVSVLWDIEVKEPTAS